MTVYDFVLDIWTHAPEGHDEHMTSAFAANIISGIAEDERVVFPDDLTPELFASIWNELVDSFIKDNEQEV